MYLKNTGYYYTSEKYHAVDQNQENKKRKKKDREEHITKKIHLNFIMDKTL